MTTHDRLNSIIDIFVNLHKGMKQRDPSWYKCMATTVGGSELAALMGISTNNEFKRE